MNVQQYQSCMYLCANHFAKCATKSFLNTNAIGPSLIATFAE